MYRMTEVIKIMCAKDDRRYEVSVSKTTEARKIMCVNDGQSNDVCHCVLWMAEAMECLCVR
jgi:adenosine/AMP kinase